MKNWTGRKLVASIMALAFVAMMGSGCTMSSASIKVSFSHRHSHNHKGMRRHHAGPYHGITRVHNHQHN